MKSKSILITIILLFVGLNLSSCRGVSPNNNTENRLRERVEGYVMARQDSDLIKLQSYFVNPGTARIGNIKYVKSKIIKVTISDDGLQAVVKIKNNLQAMGFTFKDIPQEMNWSWVKNDWFIKTANNKTNPFKKNGSSDNRVKDVNQIKQ